MAERRRKVSALYTAYLSEKEIADQLGVAPSTIHSDIVWIRQQAAGDTEAIIDREKIALDKLQKEAALQYDTVSKDSGGRMNGGGLDWHAHQLGIMKRRADLLGLDKPKKIAPTNPEGTEALPIFREIHMVIPALAEGGDPPEHDA